MQKLLNDPLLIDLFTCLFENDAECFLFFQEKLNLSTVSPSLLAEPVQLTSLDKQIYDSGKVQTFHKNQLNVLLYYLQNLLAPLQEKNVFVEKELSEKKLVKRKLLGNDGDGETSHDEEDDALVVNSESEKQEESVSENYYSGNPDSLSESSSVHSNPESEGEFISEREDAEFDSSSTGSSEFVEDLTTRLHCKRPKKTIDDIDEERKKKIPKVLTTVPLVKKSKNRPGQAARRR